MRHLIGGLTALSLLAAVPAPIAGQQKEDEPPSLSTAAEQARKAWSGHDVDALIAASPRLLVQLPDADPSAALGRAQAAALIANYVAPSQEVETAILAARVVEPGRGYVELRRRYRIAGTQEVRAESLLLSYRLGRKGWALVELRVVR